MPIRKASGQIKPFTYENFQNGEISFRIIIRVIISLFVISNLLRISDQAVLPSPGCRPTLCELDGVWLFAKEEKASVRETSWKDGPPDKTLEISAGRPWEYWLPGYDGVGWYWKELPGDLSEEGESVMLRFEAVSYWCECWLNGVRVGSHEGLSDAFSFDITPYYQPEGANILAVRVVNPPMDAEVDGFRSGAPLNQSDIPIGKAGWYYNYGGIWGRVWLETLPAVHLADLWALPNLQTGVMEIGWKIRNAGRPADCVLEFSVIQQRSGRQVRSFSDETTAVPGESSATVQLPLEGLALWSPDTPVLYTLRVVLKFPGSEHPMERSFGVREFSVAGSEFLLNGKPIVLKGLLQQRAYPRRLAAPDSWRMGARELIALKKAGFNFLRIHLGPAEPWYLDIADRLGILVMMEPPIGWIANGPRTEERVLREILALLQSHRSRACIVMWGLFNESFHLLGFTPAQMRELAGRMMQEAHLCDPSRLLIDTSGGYSEEALQGAETMIHDTSDFLSSRCLPPWSQQLRHLTDVHVYCPMPPPPQVVTNYSLLESNGQPLFLAEYGAAETPPPFEKVLAAYSERDRQCGLEDWRLHRDFHASLCLRFEQAGLAAEFSSVQNWIQALNEERAREVAAITVAARCNPRLAGFCYCQIADASGELFGVLDFWRRPKPLYFHLSQAAANPAIGIFSEKRWTTSAESFAATVAVVADSPEDCQGELRVEVAVADGCRIPVGNFSLTRPVGRAVSHDVLLPHLPSGVHEIEARLLHPDGRTAIRRERFGVVPAKPVLDVRVAARFKDLASEALAEACGLRVEAFGNNFREKQAVILLEWSAIANTPNSHGEILGQIRNIVTTGGTAVILHPDTPMLYQWLLPEFVGVQPFMRASVYLKNSPLLTGLPSGCVGGSLFSEVLGDRWDNADQVAAGGGTVEIGAFGAHMWTRPAAYVWGAGVYRIPVGRGQVIISHLNLLGRLAHDPLARTLFRNLLAYAQSLIHPGGESLLLRRCIDCITPEELEKL